MLASFSLIAILVLSFDIEQASISMISLNRDYFFVQLDVAHLVLIVALLSLHELNSQALADWIDYSGQIVLQEEDAVLETGSQGSSEGVSAVRAAYMRSASIFCSLERSLSFFCKSRCCIAVLN